MRVLRWRSTMTQWQIDWLKENPIPGMELIEQLANSWIDIFAWWWLNLYFAKYRIPEQAGDFERFVGTFSLNGVKSSNLCKPTLSK
jgi:hypothetical protein